MSVSRGREDSAALAGVVNGYAPLNSGLLIPQAYIPKAGTGAPGMILLEQHTASSSTSLDFTTFISSTYDEYAFDLLSILPATNDTRLHIQMGTGAGPTYDTGANYSWTAFVYRAGGSGVTGVESGGTYISLTFSGATTQVSNNANMNGLSGQIRLFNPQSSTYKRVMGQTSYYDAEPFRLGITLHGIYESTTALTATRFLMSSGNITSGTIRVYGIPK